MKKKYVKPTIQTVDIIMHDLCVGSNNCTTIDLNVLPIKEKKSKTYLFHRGETKDMWNSEF